MYEKQFQELDKLKKKVKENKENSEKFDDIFQKINNGERTSNPNNYVNNIFIIHFGNEY